MIRQDNSRFFAVLLGLVLGVGFSSQVLWAQERVERDSYIRDRDEMRFARLYDRESDSGRDMRDMVHLIKEISRIRDGELKILEKKIADPNTSADDRELAKAQKAQLNRLIANAHNKLEAADSFKRGALSGLIGPNAQSFARDLSHEPIGKALGSAVIFRFMNVVGNKFEKGFDTFIGNKFIELCTRVSNAISRRMIKFSQRAPFTIEGINDWRKEVLSILHDLDKKAEAAQKAASSGREVQLRAVTLPQQPEGASDRTPTVRSPEVMLTEEEYLWQSVAAGYALDLDRIARRVLAINKYYEAEAQEPLTEGFDIYAIANRIAEMLALARKDVILSAKSLRHLARPEIKFLLSQIDNDIKNRFDRLESLVARYHGLNVSAMTKSESSLDRSDKYASAFGL